MKNFWIILQKPFFVLAPMDDVTDIVFREVVSKTAAPDVFFTEFTNVDGLQSKGRQALMPRLWLRENEHPIVAQIWGKNPDNFFKTAQELVEMGFDGIDINMGCPDRSVVKNGCCSALINNHPLAKEIIDATIKGAAGKIPVSVKTRIGVNQIVTEDWIGFLLEQDIQALTIHGRTQKEMSKVPAHWDEIKKAVDLKNKRGVGMLIVGNGDVVSRQDGEQKAKKTGVDGIMIGRGIFKDIFVFSDKLEKSERSEEEMLQLLLAHMHLFEKTWQGKKNFAILRKFFKIYVSGFANAADLRAKLMESKSSQEVEDIIRIYRTNRNKNSNFEVIKSETIPSM